MGDDAEKLNEEGIKALTEYLHQLEQDYQYSISKFDNQVLIISSGALGLSLTFIKDIVPIKQAIGIWIYCIALILFIITIALSFYTHWKSAKIIDEQIILVKDHLANKKPLANHNEDKLKYNIINKKNKQMMWTLVAGLTSICLFVILNIFNTNMTDKKDSKKNIPLKKAIDSLDKNYQGLPLKPIPVQAIKKDTTKSKDNPKNTPKKDTD